MIRKYKIWNGMAIKTVTEDSSKILIELYKVRHARLVQEYEISWQQIKIFAYISGAAIAGLGYILNNIETNPNALVMLVILSITGFFIALSSLLIFYGSLKTADEIRNDLSSIELKLDIPIDTYRYVDFESTYSKILIFKKDLITVGKMLLQITFIVFWISVLVIIYQYIPSIKSHADTINSNSPCPAQQNLLDSES